MNIYNINNIHSLYNTDQLLKLNMSRDSIRRIKETKNSLDVVINPDCTSDFLCVEKNDNVCYLRSYRVYIGKDGYLIDQHQNYILNQNNQRISIPEDCKLKYINEHGEIIVANNKNKEHKIDIIGIKNIKNFTNTLQKLANGIHKHTAESIINDKESNFGAIVIGYQEQLDINENDLHAIESRQKIEQIIQRTEDARRAFLLNQ